MTQLSVADVLERAADLIEPEGRWTTEAFSRCDDGSFDRGDLDSGAAATKPACWCVLGAIAQQTGVDPLQSGAFIGGVTGDAVDHLKSIICGDVATWNDDPGNSHRNVLAKLREAAALARQQESTSC